MALDPFAPFRRLKQRLCPRVSDARAKRFCAIVFGLLIPLSIAMGVAGHESLKRRPAAFLSVAKDPEPGSRKILVTYRARDGRVLTQAMGRKRQPTDDRGVTLCLRDFHRGALPFGPVESALRLAGSPTNACSAPAR